MIRARHRWHWLCRCSGLVRRSHCHSVGWPCPVHRLGYFRGDLGSCPAGGVDDWRAEGAVVTPVGDGGPDVV
jgi:hypothetical protein